MVDAADLKSVGHIARASSSLASGTNVVISTTFIPANSHLPPTQSLKLESCQI